MSVEVHSVPTADGGYYVWVVDGARGAESTRDAAYRAGLAHHEAARARERRLGEAFWDAVAQAHRWIRPRRSR